MRSEQLIKATQDAANAVKRAECSEYPNDARRLNGRLFGLQYGAGILTQFGNSSGKVSEQVTIFSKRVTQAENNGHPNTAKKLTGVVEGLVLALGIIETDDYLV